MANETRVEDSSVGANVGDSGVASLSEMDAGEAPRQPVRSATVVQTRTLAPHVRELTLQPEGDSFVGFQAGQWLSLRLPVGARPPLVRAYSLASAPHADGTLTLAFDRVPVGLGSEYLWSVEAGTSLEFAGPMGNFVLPTGDAADTPLLLVGRFTGVVPFRAMLQSMKIGYAPTRPVHLVHGATSEADLIYRDEFAALADEADWFEYHPIPNHDGEIPFLASHAPAWMPFTPMACGVREFTAPTRAFFVDTLEFTRKQVRVENYSG